MSQHTHRNTWFIALLITSTQILGCEPMFDVGMPSCWSNAECSDGNVCVFNHCISPEPNKLVVSAKIIPVPSSGHVMQQVPAIDLNSGHSLDLTLLDAVEVVGTVTLKGHGFASYNVPGNLEARSPGEIPGHDYRFTTRSLEGLNESGQGYALRLLPGREYSFRFRPDDLSIPVHTWQQTIGDDVLITHNITLPSDLYVSVAGFVRFSATEVVPNAHVTALLPNGTAVASTTADAIKGFFEMNLPPDTDEISFRIKPGDGGTIFPEHLTDVQEVTTEIALWVEKPESPPVKVALKLVATTDGGLSAGVPETTVTLATADGKLRQSVTTDAYGVANFEALPGQYNVAICPSPGSDNASYMGSIMLTEADVTPEIELEKRVRLQGAIIRHNSSPLDAGDLILTRVLTDDSKTTLVTPAPFSVSIAADGKFDARVDPGLYNLRVSPDPSTDAPPFTLTDVDIRWDQELTIELPPLDLIHLRVLNPEGVAMSDVSIELYVSGEEATTVDLLSVTTTGSDGGTDLLVPLLD